MVIMIAKSFHNWGRCRKSWSTAQKPWRVGSFDSDMTEDKPTFFFFHFQRTGSVISDARQWALLLDLRQQHTTKATGNAWCLHLQTLSLALALAQCSRCEHLFFLQLMGTDPRSSPFAADTRLSNWDLKQWTDRRNNHFPPDTRLPNWDLNQLPNKKYQMTGNTRIRARNSNLIIYAALVSQHIAKFPQEGAHLSTLDICNVSINNTYHASQHRHR